MPKDARPHPSKIDHDHDLDPSIISGNMADRRTMYAWLRIVQKYRDL